MKPAAVIFDMDGTLFDSEQLGHAIWRQLGEEFHLPVSDAFLHDLSGRDWNSAKDVFARYFPAKWPLEAVKERQRVLFTQFYAQSGAAPKPGFYAILDYLKQHEIPMAIATSSYRSFAEANLRHANARHYFQDIITGYDADVKAGKPAADIYLCAAKRLCVSIERCMVVEDSGSGIMAAANANAMGVLIPEHPLSEEICAKARWVFKRLDQIIPLLESEAMIDGI